MNLGFARVSLAKENTYKEGHAYMLYTGGYCWHAPMAWPYLADADETDFEL